MWKFIEIDEEKQGSLTGDIGDKDFDSYDLMLREGIQNSVDAKSKMGQKDGQPVKIEIDLSEIETEKLHQFLFKRPNDKEHFQKTKKVRLSNENKMRILKFEDYNTPGIDGEIYEDGKIDKSSNLYAFIYHEQLENENKSHQNASGSRGIGKSAFIYASEYRCYFFSTASKQNTFHMGRANLKNKREVGNITYTKDAYFTLDGEKNISLKDDILNEFNKLFEINRENPKTLGTSIIVLSPIHDETKDSRKFINASIQSIVQNFYFLFIQGILEINLSVSSTIKQTINQDTIIELMAKHFDSDYIDFIQDVYTPKTALSDIIFDYPENEFRGLLNIITDKEKNKYLNYYNSGKTFKAIFPYKINNKMENITFYIKKADMYGKKAENMHLRRGDLLIINDAKKILGSNEQMYLAVNLQYTDCPETYSELRELEDNSHSTWGTSEYSTARLGIQTRIPTFLNNILISEENNEITTIGFLSKFFPSLLEEKSNKKREQDKDGNEEEIKKGTKIEIESNNQIINIDKRSNPNGFEIYSDIYESTDNILILFAFQQEGKSKNQSIKGYKDYHFEVDKLNVEVDGATIHKREENQIELTKINKEFSLLVTGFPEYDLTIDIKGLKNATDI